MNCKSNTTEQCTMDNIHDAQEELDVPEWIPPEGQTGDGKTSLNNKFGY